MTRIGRRVLFRGLLVGAALTLGVVAADLAGFLDAPEKFCYDLRARHFQFQTPKPTDRLVHVDIDDRALEGIGAWPWPRAKLAAILDEMRLAGVKAVALDVLFSERQPLQPEVTPQDAPDAPLRLVDNDAELAAAIERLGCVIVPASLSFDTPDQSVVYQAVLEELKKNPEVGEDELVRMMEPRDRPRAAGDRTISDVFLGARREALFERISQEMAAAPERKREDLRRALLKSQQEIISSPLTRAFDEQFARWESISAIERFGADVTAAMPPVPPVLIQALPIPELARSAAGSGFVDYKTDRDGVLRSVPLLAQRDGRIIPQMGLSLAMLTLGVKTKDLRVSEDALVLPVQDGRQIAIPVHISATDPSAASMFQIPWFGGPRWQGMYDFPNHQRTRQHISVIALWDAHDTKRKIIKNNANADVALTQMREILGIKAPATTRSTDDAADAHAAEIQRVLTEAKPLLDEFNKLKPQEIDNDGRLFLQRIDALRSVRDEGAKLAAQLTEQRKHLAQQLGGKSVLLGWIATGRTDVTPTSIHATCPGVVAHGVIFNAIMTGEFWKRMPIWVTIAFTLSLGLLTALLASWMPPQHNFVVTLLLAGGYVCLNGLVLFDRQNLIVDMSPPLIAIAAVWAGCALNRIQIESHERARITRQFRAYHDPNLVDQLVENPQWVRTAGETRELTVVFTDLVGFTDITERLAEQTVGLLNEFMNRMVPLIRAEDGCLNKFLGDGIMFFFGAPIPNDDHAARAVRTVLAMMQAVAEFDADVASRGLGVRIQMRAGICTGNMVVGDAGSIDPLASDYTVLGDTVNLAARLEAANKMTGTSTLINARAAELIGDSFVLRPVGKLQVAGKSEAVMAYEPLASTNSASEDQKRFAGLSDRMVQAFMAARFDEVRAAADELDSAYGPSILTRLYRERSERFVATSPDGTFDGRITFSEK